jgi:hypothetical protein
MANYRTQHVSTVPAGWRVRSKRAGGHVVRIAFPPGRRKKGSGKVVEVLHPKRENPGCDVERKNPEQLLIFGLGNPLLPRCSQCGKTFRGHEGDDICFECRRKVEDQQLKRKQEKARAEEKRHREELEAQGVKPRRRPKRNAGGFGNHKPGCPCAFCQRAAKLQSGELKPPKLPNRSKRKNAKRNVRATAKKSPVRGAFSRKKSRRNPDDTQQAVQLYQTFHGKDPRGVVEKQEPAIMREDYAAIGPLEYLLIKSPLNETYKVEFEGDGVILASSPDGKQLYCIGGNQNLSAVLDADSLQKDFADLGECLEVQYLARKVHSNFEPVSWHHKFGEKNGQRPELVYDKLNKRIFFAGGAYYIDTSAEISPGIEN